MAGDPPRCEPPEEARGERAHTLRRGISDSLHQWVDGRWYADWHFAWTPAEAAALGYRWLAVAKPPEGAK